MKTTRSQFVRWITFTGPLSAILAAGQLPPPNGPGGALQFDGVNDHLTAAPPSIPAGNSPYTIEAWIKPDTMHVGAVAAWGNYGVNNQVNAFVLTGSGLVNYWWANDLTAPTANLAGAWHHVAATFDGTTRRILLDGTVVAQDNPVGHNAGTANFRIGLANVGQYFKGQMDEVRIWSVARTPAQIQEAMRRQLWGNEPGLVACWRCDEGAGLSAFDATGTGANTATLVNGPAWAGSGITPFAPTVTTLPVVLGLAGSATLNGAAMFNGAITTEYFQWGTSLGYGNVTAAQNSGSPTGSNTWSQVLSGLSAGVDYHHRAVATNAHGASYGLNRTFRFPVTLVVQNINDSGPGSFRQALADAGSGDTITFGPNVTGAIVLTSGELVVARSVSIQGPGAGILSISGNNGGRVLNVTAGVTVVLTGLSITHGRVWATDLEACAEGGGVFNSGTLRLTNCAFAFNHVRGGPGADAWLSFSAGAGGCGQGGAIANYGDLTAVGCTFESNTAEGGVGGSGGASQPRGALGGTGRGGAIWSGTGRVLVLDSTLGNNSAAGGVGGAGTDVNGGHNDAAIGGSGGSGMGGGIFAVNGTPEMRSCTLLNNQALGGQGGRGGNSGNGRGGPGGGGGLGSGGGLWAESSAASPFLVNCTVYANEAEAGRGGDGGMGSGWPNGATGLRGMGQGGGLHVSGAGAFVPRVYLCTITLNFASGRLGTVGGGGVQGRAECRSTIVAGNFASDAIIGAPDCAGDFIGSTFNLIGVADGGTGFTGPNNQAGSLSVPLDPRLGLLQDNGGPTLTLALLNNSPALDRGHSSGVMTDQRGALRPTDLANVPNAAGGDGSDIGAHENEGCLHPLPAIEVTTLADAGPGSLREAIACVMPGGTITFAPNVTGTITLTSGELVIGRSLAVQGPGARVLTVSGNGASRVFRVVAPDVSITGLTIADGLVSGNEEGSGLRANASRLAVTNCVFFRNGDIWSSGGGGADLEAATAATFHGCTFDGNIGDAGALRAAYSSGLTLVNCTFSRNTARDSVIMVYWGDAWLISCTVAGNSFTSGSASALLTFEFGALNLRNCLIADSPSPPAGDIYSYIPSQVVSGGHNLIGATWLNPPWAPTDIVGGVNSPQVGPLEYHGGPTPTMLPLVGSLAFERGDDALATGGATDQNGRPRRAGCHVDIGAVEWPWPAGADVLVVNHADSGGGSLRDALACAAPGQTIEFAPWVRGTITLTSGELVINKSLTLLGPGPDALAVSGGNAQRIFSVLPESGTATISGLTLREGRATSPQAQQSAWGGAILNQASLTVSNCVFSANEAVGRNGVAGQPGTAGSPAQGGAIYNRAALTLIGVTFQSNRARGGNGGNGATGTVQAGGPGGAASGGALYSEQRFTALNCTLVANEAIGGAGGNGGIAGLSGRGPGGAGGGATGGQMAHDSPSAGALIHCTMATGRAAGGVGGTGSPAGVSGAGRGGGVWSLSDTTTLLNTIIASNLIAPTFVAANGPDVLGPVTSLGHNLIGVTDGSSGWSGTDLRGTAAAPLNPRLGPLALNYSLTPNFALLPDSPAINTGDDASLAPPWSLATDQRGFPRRVGARVDIGAFESCHDEPAIQVTSLRDDAAVSLRAAIECLAPGGTITFAPGLQGDSHLTGGALVLDKDINIVGPGADQVSLFGVSDRVLRVTAGRAWVSGLTLRNGSAQGGPGLDATLLTDGGNGEDGCGGGVLNAGDLTLVDCMLLENAANGGGGGQGGDNLATGNLQPGAGGRGGGGLGGAICNSNRLTLLRCTLAWNEAQGGPGGTGGQDFGSASSPGGTGGAGGIGVGAAVFNSGRLGATNCTFLANLARGGPGGYGGPGLPVGGTGGTGGQAGGGAIYDMGESWLVGCTLQGGAAAGEQGGDGGHGGMMDGPQGADAQGVVGGFLKAAIGDGPAWLRNTVIAGSIADYGPDTGGTFQSGGFNFVGEANALMVTFGLDAPTDRVGTPSGPMDPLLDVPALNYHGGTTLVIPPLPNSPLIDQGHSSGAATDQRGLARPANQAFILDMPGGDGSDIGAFEVGAEPPPTLTIRRGPGGTVILSWPDPSTGYVLQETTDLNAPGGGWVDVLETPVVNGGMKEVTLPASGFMRLFRLRGQ